MDSKPSLRQQKVSRLIQKELGQFFQRERLTVCDGQFVTVTKGSITPDLSIAYIYLSIFPSEKAKTTLDFIKIHTKSIRFYLGNQVRSQLRIIPELEFFIDDSLDYIEKIDKLLKK